MWLGSDGHPQAAHGLVRRSATSPNSATFLQTRTLPAPSSNDPPVKLEALTCAGNLGYPRTPDAHPRHLPDACRPLRLRAGRCPLSSGRSRALCKEFRRRARLARASRLRKLRRPLPPPPHDCDPPRPFRMDHLGPARAPRLLRRRIDSLHDPPCRPRGSPSVRLALQDHAPVSSRPDPCRHAATAGCGCRVRERRQARPTGPLHPASHSHAASRVT